MVEDWGRGIGDEVERVGAEVKEVRIGKEKWELR